MRGSSGRARSSTTVDPRQFGWDRALLATLRHSTLPFGETIRPFHVGETRLGFDEYDVVNQGLVSHHYRAVDGKFEKWSIPFRYVWPSELDLMARLAGMTLRERWSGWRREPFTSDSTRHVSVWEKRGAAR